MGKKLTLIGTSHISDVKDRVKEEIIKINPQVVAIELDQERYEEIISNKQPSQLPGEINEILAGLFGRRVRDDFRGAIEGAKEVGAKIELIDKNMREIINEIFGILQEFYPEIKEEKAIKTFQDRVKADPDRYRKIISIDSSVGNLSKIREKSGVDSERWNRYEESLGPYTQKIKEVWEGREEYMAPKIRELAEEYDNIVVITGAAHVSNLENKLEGLSIECVFIT
ncbi:hypothetical protein C5S32_02615 [ANME-1 cluster archaeon GoMg1]|nr:hypothetical protein [ANME-1 cluster archaeon GoMg1]